jgi:hypothetical protein
MSKVGEVVAAFGPNAKARTDWFDEFFRHYKPTRSTSELSDIMNRQQSDKGNGWHTYTQFYEYFFSTKRSQVRNVFEVGLGTNNTDVQSNMGAAGSPGASLRGWREYFPRAHIFGADIDRRVLFQDYRISTFFVDQTDRRAVEGMWAVVGDVKFDLLIDDGLHEYHACESLLSVSLSKLAHEGIYVIEDIVLQPDNLEKYKEIISRLTSDSVIVHLHAEQNSYDNCVAVIWR